MAAQPILEEYLMTGSLEETNQWYAIAKITGVKLIEALRQQYNRDYVSLMPTNLYGPGDNYDLETSHVLPALLQKFHDAKINNKNEVVLWGSGKPLREFLHVDDLAFAVIFAIENKLSDSFYNIGSEKEITIRDLANIVKQIVNFEGKIKWDLTKPDGTMRKLIDSKKFMQTGWQPSIELIDGISKVYNDQFKRSS